MKKTKSVSAYTKIWLNRHRDYWHEGRFNLICFKKMDIPKIVRKGVEKINERRIKQPALPNALRPKIKRDRKEIELLNKEPS